MYTLILPVCISTGRHSTKSKVILLKTRFQTVVVMTFSMQVLEDYLATSTMEINSKRSLLLLMLFLQSVIKYL